MNSIIIINNVVVHDVVVRIMAVILPDAYGKGIGLLVQTAMVQLHAAVVQVNAVDELVVWAFLLLRLH